MIKKTELPDLDLRSIITEEFQQMIQESFAYATGFGVVFVDKKGRHIGKGSNFTRFCTAINQTAEGKEYCTASNDHAIALALQSGKPSIYICHAGMVNIEIPIIFEGMHLGAITAGQVFCSEPNCYPKDQRQCKLNWQKDEQLSSWLKEVPVLTKQQIESTTVALQNITHYIVQRVAYTRMQEELSKSREELLLTRHRQLELEHNLKLAEFDALSKQVTPHFIFNVINSVSRLISMRDLKTASEMLDAFARMMRLSLSENAHMIPLSQELDYIRGYLTIQKIRFGGRLHYKLHCDAQLQSCRIPFFCLQPLVENSIEHGILSKPDGGQLIISCTEEKAELTLCIMDDGIGISAETLTELNALFGKAPAEVSASSHLGLFHCYYRLKLHYGSSFSFQIQSSPMEGTRIRIRIPKELRIQTLSEAQECGAQ